MKLKYLNERNEFATCSLEDALRLECSSFVPNLGVVENNAQNIEMTAHFMSLLIGHLYEKGFIDKDFLLDKVLQGAYEESESSPVEPAK